MWGSVFAVWGSMFVVWGSVFVCVVVCSSCGVVCSLCRIVFVVSGSMLGSVFVVLGGMFAVQGSVFTPCWSHTALESVSLLNRSGPACMTNKQPSNRVYLLNGDASQTTGMCGVQTGLFAGLNALKVIASLANRD